MIRAPALVVQCVLGKILYSHGASLHLQGRCINGYRWICSLGVTLPLVKHPIQGGVEIHVFLQLPHLTSPHLTSPHLTSPHLTSPHLTSPHLTSPHLTSPHLTSPHLTSPHLTSPHLTSPHLTSPHLTSPHLTSPHLTSPHLILPYLSAAVPYATEARVSSSNIEHLAQHRFYLSCNLNLYLVSL